MPELERPAPAAPAALAALSPLRPLPPAVRDRLHPLRVYVGTLAPGEARRTTVAALRLILPHFRLPDLDLVPWASLRYEHVAYLRAQLVDQGYAPATVNRCLAGVRGVLRAAWRLRQLSTDDFHRACDVASVPGSRLPAGRSLSLSQLEGLFGACVDGTRAGARDAALVALLFSTGLRRSEAASVLLAQLDRDSWRVTVIGKGNRERAVPLRAGGREALEGWLRCRGVLPGYLLCRVTRTGIVIPDAPLSASALRQRLSLRAAAAGVPWCTPHDLRRTFVTHLLDAGIDLNVVRKLAGHAQVQTTARYDHRDFEAMERAVEVLRTPFVDTRGVAG